MHTFFFRFASFNPAAGKEPVTVSLLWAVVDQQDLLIVQNRALVTYIPAIGVFLAGLSFSRLYVILHDTSAIRN